MQIGFYGDDFTGSIDALLQLSRAGLKGQLTLSPVVCAERSSHLSNLDAVGIAGVARSLSRADLRKEVDEALRALSAMQPLVVQYKACSTADSSASVGNLGTVIEIAQRLFPQQCFPLVFAQPDFGRYTVFGHHFAAEGGVVYRLDRQPTMANHPSTPMRESELALHLSQQTTQPIGSLHLTDDRHPCSGGTGRSADAAVVLDALSSADLSRIGETLVERSFGERQPQFCLGSGGLTLAVAQALAQRSGGEPVSVPSRSGSAATGRPVFAVSASRSTKTLQQIEEAERAGWYRREISWDSSDLDAEMSDCIGRLRNGQSVVLTSPTTTAPSNPIATIATRFSEAITAVLAKKATNRVIICGGDTSSRILRLLGGTTLAILANPHSNAVLCRLSADDPEIDGLEIALKGGQVGPPDYFEVIRQC